MHVLKYQNLHQCVEKKLNVEYIKILTRLAKASGYLTYQHINTIIPDSPYKAREITFYIAFLRSIGIKIVKAVKKNYKNNTPKYSDKSIETYFNRAEQFPLLTRREEIKICKKIEEAEHSIRNIFIHFDFAIPLLLKTIDILLNNTELFESIVDEKYVVDKKRYLKNLPALRKKLIKLNTSIKKRKKLTWLLEQLHLKQFVIETMAIKADEYYLEYTNNRKKTSISKQISTETYRALKDALQNAQNARLKLIEGNFRLIGSIVKKYRNKTLSDLYLIQKALDALITAVETFDYKRGYKFSTFAIWWIRRVLSKEVESLSPTCEV